jgi:hypothetical protein
MNRVSFPRHFLFGAAAVGLLAAGCQGPKKTSQQQAAAENSTMAVEETRPETNAFPEGRSPQRIPPGTCRLAGKVVAILPQRDVNKQAPCGQVACRALVRIERIAGYGAAFQPHLAAGQEIKVYFTFTLSPSGKYFPELTTPLPGLGVGSVFEADVTGPGDAGTQQEPWFRVTVYKVRR